MKRQNFFWSVFFTVFRLPIYESTAAIFWQSASYVFHPFRVEFLRAAKRSVAKRIMEKRWRFFK